MKMKAIVFHDIRNMSVADVPIPVCGNNSMLIKVVACGVCSTDVRVYNQGHKLISPPRILGHEVTGVIIKVGTNVSGYQKGDRVAVAPSIPCGCCHYCRIGQQTMCDHLVTIGFDYDGGFADYMLIPYIAIVNGCVNKLPDSISYEEATLAEPLACCINAQELARIGFGQTVVVLGAGPLGCMHAMLAKCRGAAKTILVDVLPERIERAQVTDADLYVNAAKEDLVPYIRAITGKRGADTVIIACESEKAEKDALAMVAKHGTISLFSRRSDTEKGLGFDINAVHFKEVFIVGSHGSSPRQNTIAIEMISAKRIAIINLITHRMEIDRIWDGLTLCDRKACLRVVITKYDNDALSTCLDI